MPKKRDIPGEREECQNYTNHETEYTNVRGSHQISPHKPSKCGRENTGKGSDIQNKTLHVFNGVPQQESVWIQSVNEHNSHDCDFRILVQEEFSKGKISAIVSLNVEGPLKFAGAPSVLKNFKESGCPRNLYKLTKNYFSKRWETMAKNNIKLERAVSIRCRRAHV